MPGAVAEGVEELVLEPVAAVAVELIKPQILR